MSARTGGLPIEEILATEPLAAERAQGIGRSREGRELLALRAGRGPVHLSLIGGCHADEPVGPAMLERLAAFLSRCEERDPLVREWSWWIVPQVNPDGAARNAGWTAGRIRPHGGGGLDLRPYLDEVARELPGEDVEFGFPRDAGDADARPENRAVADFLRDGAPFALHVSFHGMAFAAGPWFLMERGWAERTRPMRERLRARVAALGYQVHDVDRRGEKGFHRIDEGFTSRPDSGAMRAHFEALGEPQTAELFRPSSMEHVRGLGGDPLTLVSEMPLFLLPAEHYRQASGKELVRPPALAGLRELAGDPEALAAEVKRLGIRPMPIADQMRLQLSYLEEGMAAVR
jgi:hypothetical protein